MFSVKMSGKNNFLASFNQQVYIRLKFAWGGGGCLYTEMSVTISLLT